jgi:hypothetical protein
MLLSFQTANSLPIYFAYGIQLLSREVSMLTPSYSELEHNTLFSFIRLAKFCLLVNGIMPYPTRAHKSTKNGQIDTLE